jgi:hypothetical protein
VIDLAGYALAFLAGGNGAALAAIDRAIVLNPNFVRAFGNRALVLNYQSARRSDPGGATGDAAEPARSAGLFLLSSAGYRAPARGGLSWADRALRENAGAPSLITKLSLCGYLGRPAHHG